MSNYNLKKHTKKEILLILFNVLFLKRSKNLFLSLLSLFESIEGSTDILILNEHTFV